MDIKQNNKLSNNNWSRTEGNKKYIWDVPTLVQFAKEENYKTFDLNLDCIDLSGTFNFDTYLGFLKYVKRINEVDFKYPILIDDLGTICDGWHRVAKAIISGKKTIKAIRLNEMPAASSVEDI